MLDRAALDLLRGRAQHDVEAGLEHGGVEGCSLAIARDGEIRWQEVFAAVRADTPILLLSITRPVFESALRILVARGFDPDTPVIEIVPEFTGETRGEITIAMVETHLAGFAWHALDYPAARDRAARLAAMRDWRLDGPPGAYEHNPVNAGWVLAEIVEWVSSRDFRHFLKSEVPIPLGLASVHDLGVGVSEVELAPVLLRRNYMVDTPDPAKRVPMAYGLDTQAGLALATSGVAGFGTAASVGSLYQAYSHNPHDLWQPAVRADERDRTRFDGPDVAGRPMRCSFSFVQSGAPANRYGERTFSGPTLEHVFGHQGQGGQIARAGSASGSSFAYPTATVVFPPGDCSHPRARALSALAANVLTF